MPPTAGETTRSRRPRLALFTLAARARQRRSVRSGYMNTRAFWMKTGLRSPEVRMKWPSRIAPDALKMSMTSASVMPPSCVQPGDRADHLQRAQLSNHRHQMLQVPDTDVDGQRREVRRIGHGQVDDVAVIVGDDLGNLG